MKAAFFHDHKFGRDASGTHYSNGALSYRAISRYLRHFDQLVVVGRTTASLDSTRTVASGPGVEFACVPPSSRVRLAIGAGIREHVRRVLSRVDCAIVRLPSGMGRIACEEADRAGVPWMAEVVGCVLGALWNHGSLAGKALAFPMYVLTRRRVAQARFAVYVSQRHLQRRYPCAGESVGCSNVAIDAPATEVLERRLDRIARLGKCPPMTLGLVGSLDVDYKGHETALRALRVLRDHSSAHTIRFLGPGDPARWRARAAALGVARQVAFDGTLPAGGAVLRWMDELDLLLVPSLTEGVPRALVEGMSRALPAVATNVGGIPELLDAAWMHRPADHRGLARLVRTFVENPEAMKVQARRNWSTSREYAADVIEQRRDRLLEAFVEHVSANRRRSAGRDSRADEALVLDPGRGGDARVR